MEREQIDKIYNLIKRNQQRFITYDPEIETGYAEMKFKELYPDHDFGDWDDLNEDGKLDNEIFTDWDAERDWLMAKYPGEEQAINDYITMWQLETEDYGAILPEYLK